MRYYESCEPCFNDDCRVCASRDRALAERKRLRARLRKLEDLLARAAGALEEELQAAGADEVRAHPTLRGHERVAAACRRALAPAARKGGAL